MAVVWSFSKTGQWIFEFFWFILALLLDKLLIFRCITKFLSFFEAVRFISAEFRLVLSAVDSSAYLGEKPRDFHAIAWQGLFNRTGMLTEPALLCLVLLQFWLIIPSFSFSVLCQIVFYHFVFIIRFMLMDAKQTIYEDILIFILSVSL